MRSCAFLDGHRCDAWRAALRLPTVRMCFPCWERARAIRGALWQLLVGLLAGAACALILRGVL